MQQIQSGNLIVMEYCQNCDKNLPQEKYQLHLGYCRRNIKRCPDCKLPYDINEEQQHQEEYHKKAKCKYCSIQFKAQQIQVHQAACHHQPIICSYCQLGVPKQLYNEHVSHCQSRTETCEKCFKAIKKKQFQNHYANCYGPQQNQQPQQSFSSQTYYQGQGIQNSNSVKYSAGSGSMSYSVASSSFSSYKPSQQANRRIISSSTRVGQPRVVSRRIISGPNAGKQLPIQQPTQKVEREAYTDPVTGATSIRTVTTRSYYQKLPDKSSQQPQKKLIQSSYQPSYHQNFGGISGVGQQDPELQAALLASLGYKQQSLEQINALIKQKEGLQKKK